MPSRVGSDPSQGPASCLWVDLSARARDGAWPTGQASSDLIRASPKGTVAVLSARPPGGDHHHRYHGGDSHHQHLAEPTRQALHDRSRYPQGRLCRGRPRPARCQARGTSCAGHRRRLRPARGVGDRPGAGEGLRRRGHRFLRCRTGAVPVHTWPPGRGSQPARPGHATPYRQERPYRRRDGRPVGALRRRDRHPQARRRRSRDGPHAQDGQGFRGQGAHAGAQPDQGATGHRPCRTTRDTRRVARRQTP